MRVMDLPAARVAPVRTVLAVTADPALADDIVRLGAAVGIPVVVAADLPSALGRWGAAGLVVLGVDLLPAAAAASAGRRPGVLVVRRRDPWSAAPDDSDPWRGAVAVGAEQVLELPDDERALVDRLSDAADDGRHGGPVVAVVPGSGGAGASTLAVRLALARAGDCLLVDADPLGGGLDIALEAEGAVGLRWPDLAATRGRVPPAALRQALPDIDGVTLVSHGREPGPGDVQPLAAVLDAGRRGFGLTVVDLPRSAEAAHEVVGSRAAGLVVVVATGVRPVAAASALVAAVGPRYADVVAVTRPIPGGVDDDAVAEVLGIEVVASLAALGPRVRRLGRRPDPVRATLTRLGVA